MAEALEAEVQPADRRCGGPCRGDRPTPTPDRPTRDAAPDPPAWQPTRIAAPERLVNLIHDALRRNMLRDDRIMLIGEDIEGPYGGAFKVTKDLSREFPGRVRNTPISEAAIVGLGNGLALSGLVPVCEIMFGDFLTLAADQLINHASKFNYMYNDQVDLRLVVRTPMGGKRGYGPTHSQSLEKHFLGLPGTTDAAPCTHRYDPGLIYDTLFATIDRPTIVIENKLLYGLRVADTGPRRLLRWSRPTSCSRRPGSARRRARRDDPLLRRHAGRRREGARPAVRRARDRLRGHLPDAALSARHPADHRIGRAGPAGS